MLPLLDVIYSPDWETKPNESAKGTRSSTQIIYYISFLSLFKKQKIKIKKK
jgi:hypothetical protein